MSEQWRMVDTELTYLAPGAFVNRRFVSQGREVNTGTYLPYPVRIGDARPIRHQFTLDGAGFVLADHASEVNDFLNPAEIDEIYVAEAEKEIRRLTGADEVVSRGWMVRTSGDIQRQENVADYRHQGGLQPPAAEVHVDFSPACAERLARHTYEALFSDAPPYRRFAITSLWRAFSPPPQDWPLALCDARSVGDDEGTGNALVVVDEIPDHETMVGPYPEEALSIEASIFHHNPAHRWWYFPEMTRDEVLLFKFYDSDHERAWRVPHTAFRDTSAVNANVRQSIEVRAIAYYLQRDRPLHGASPGKNNFLI